MSIVDKALQLLPYKSSRSIHFSRAQRYFQNVIREKYTDRDLEVLRFLNSQSGHKTLLTGHQKSGNTWTRFIIANYFHLLVDPEVTETLTFDQLYQAQSNVLEYKELSPPPKGYPLFFYSHQHYRKIFEAFDTVVYVYRNPLDTLISYYYFTTRRDKPFPSHDLSEKRQKELLDIDKFVLHFAMNWVLFHKRTLQQADIVLCYEEMKQHPEQQFRELLERMGESVDLATLQRSIELSSFESIKKKQGTIGKPQGHSSSDLKVPFTRSGEMGQYLQELKPQTIDKVRWTMNKLGVDVKI